MYEMAGVFCFCWVFSDLIKLVWSGCCGEFISVCWCTSNWNGILSRGALFLCIILSPYSQSHFKASHFTLRPSLKAFQLVCLSFLSEWRNINSPKLFAELTYLEPPIKLNNSCFISLVFKQPNQPIFRLPKLISIVCALKKNKITTPALFMAILHIILWIMLC